MFSGQRAKEGKRAAEVDPDAYEVTKFGRRPKWRGRRGLTLTVLAAGVAAAAVWMLV